MEPAVVVDIGSTFTKAVLIDLGSGALLARSQASTTVQMGVQHSLAQAENKLFAEAQISPHQVKLRLASSSAAGGLRMVTIGLVPELTAEAARLAALGAGARVLAVYSYKLSFADVLAISHQQPDVILLSGGADGGDTETVIHNAGALVNCKLRPPVVYAGNKDAAERVGEILGAAGFTVYSRSNVMPRLGTLQVDAARAAIRQVFFENIVKSKGLEVVRTWADMAIIPTPSAVQNGVTLAAGVLSVDKLMAFDIGGATTDVYSVGGSDPRAGAHLH
ncbi:MAG: glutamate mutase L, partial [Bacillota bacterium]|nr:glutamate mutase L [Bacillota bacterium]